MSAEQQGSDGDGAEGDGNPDRSGVGVMLGRGRLVAAAALCLVGAIWCAQGIGWLKGSFMTGDSTWLMIGAVCFAVGLALFGAHARSTR